MKHLNGRAIAVSAMIAARLHRCEPGFVLVLVRRDADSGGGMSDPFTGIVPAGDLRRYRRLPFDQYCGHCAGPYHAGGYPVRHTATAIAAVLSYLLRNVRIKRLAIPAALPPILINGLIIGLELTWLSGSFQWDVFWTCAVSVTAGQIIPCLVLGVLLVWILEKKGLDQKLFGKK